MFELFKITNLVYDHFLEKNKKYLLRPYTYTNTNTFSTPLIVDGTSEENNGLNAKTEEFTGFEKNIYDIAGFHCNRLSIDICKIYIEFYVVDTSTHLLDIVKDTDALKTHNIYKFPLATTYTYINDTLPTIFTQYNYENYKYKDFDSSNNVFLFSPKEYNHICIDGSLYHGFLNKENFNGTILAINLWNDFKPNTPTLYCEIHEKSVYNDTITIFEKKCEDEIPITYIEDSIIKNDFFEEIIYEKNVELFDEFKNSIDINIFQYDKLTMIITCEKQYSHMRLTQNCCTDIDKARYGEAIKDIYDVLHNKVEDSNRFLEYYIHENVFNNDISKWIISEFENIMLLNEYIFDTDSINITRVPNILNFLKIFFENTIVPALKKDYGFNDNISYNISEILISKNIHSNNIIYKEKSFFTFYILLSSVDEKDSITLENTKAEIELPPNDIIFFPRLLEHNIKCNNSKYLVFYIDIII